MDSVINKTSAMSQPIIDSAEASSLRTRTKIFPCTYQSCGKVFAKKHDLLRHNLSHLAQRPNNSETFPLTQVEESSLSGDLSLLEKRKSHVCSLASCRETFETFTQLKEHIFAEHCAPKSETSTCISESPSEYQQLLNSPDSDDKEDVDRLIKLAIMENQILKQRLQQSQQLLLGFHQQLKLFDNLLRNTNLTN